jgi:hypothetical protein
LGVPEADRPCLLGRGVYQYQLIPETWLFAQKWKDRRLNGSCEFASLILVKPRSESLAYMFISGPTGAS